ncbi:unnamed protein product [Haemonchus placei]|uniref:Uncharacterized protein n=1 Tax=Haemonchus placei TaxID=6290 RepID=A0A3P7WIG8_HAEPC|nr:unnamed protein product [Haemonchus placei]
MSLMTEEEKAEQLRIEQEEAAKAVKKKVIKDGHSEKAAPVLIPQRVVPAEEMVPLDESGVIPEEEICELEPKPCEEEKVTMLFLKSSYIKWSSRFLPTLLVGNA